LLPWLESVARPAHRFHLEAAASYVSTFAECSSASVTPPTCLAAHRTSQRAMRWTDFCHLTSSYQYPRIVGSPCVKRSRASAWRRSTAITTVRFASAGCTDLPSGSSQRGGRFLPVTLCARLASDTPVASPTVHVTLARARPMGAAKIAFKTARVNERPERRPGMSSILRRPSPRDALSDTRLGPTPALWLCHHGTGCRRLCYSVPLLRAPRSLGPRPRAPLPRGIALL